MPNTHQIVDSDPKFSIDPVTRTISNSSRKTRLIQYDHNSEKISFTMPRIVEGHDMTLCNNVRIQYINLDDETQHKKSVGVYSVDDITQNEEDDTISFSWLISRNATKYVGTLNFLIQFECILDDGTVEYSWHTDAFKGITVSEGMDVEDTIVHYYPDIFEQWKNEVIQMTANTLSQYATTAYVDTSISELGNIVTEEKLSEDLSHKINSVNNVSPDENGNVEIDAVLYSSQRLSSEQQEIARTNIDAVSTDSLEEISPDDNIVDGKPWTSRKIVDTLCPPFDVSGSAVTCHPVERYPLGVVSRIDATQSGTGDPSPDNIRPIVGRDSVTVTRCGKNLLNPEKNAYITYNPYGLTITYIGDNKVHLSGIYSRTGGSFAILDTTQKSLAGRNLKITGFTIDGTKKSYTLYGLRTKDETVIAMLSEFVEGDVIDMTVAIVVSQDTPSAYEPYIGDTYTITLPETIYGGELDWNTGVLTVNNKLLTFNGTENFEAYSYTNGFFLIIPDVKKILKNNYVSNFNCSHFTAKAFYDKGYFQDASDAFAQEAGGTRNIAFRKSGVEKGDIISFKNWLAAQYAAGTPVQLCYELETPYTIQITPQQITALSGVNTLYTDSGDISVSGRTDMIWLTQSLIDRIAALETAAVSE